MPMNREMPVTCGIYVIRRVGTDECYVGQSVDIENRWRGHRQDLTTGKHRAIWMKRVFDKHGISAFSFEILEIVPRDKDLLTAAEQRWMDALNPCYNVAPAAGSTLGIKRTPEQSANLSAARKLWYQNHPEHREFLGSLRRGLPGPRKGVVVTEETRAKMSLASLGRPSPRKGVTLSEETKQKLRKANLGRSSPFKGRVSPMRGVPRSPETRQKIRDGHRRRKESSSQISLTLEDTVS